MTYADDLCRVARDGTERKDLERIDALAGYLADLHRPAIDPGVYEHEVRKLSTAIVDDVESITCDATTTDRLESIVHACRTWQHQTHRLARVHGNFAPEAIRFYGQLFTTTDPRTSPGEPADDVMVIMVALLAHAPDLQSWSRAIRPLWHRFWITYLHARPDPDLFTIAPPWFARHAVAYCRLHGVAGNEQLLELAARALHDGWLDPMDADDMYTPKRIALWTGWESRYSTVAT